MEAVQAIAIVIGIALTASVWVYLRWSNEQYKRLQATPVDEDIDANT